MKIYNQDKTQELIREELDFEKGYLQEDKLLTVHHDALEAKTAEEVYEELQAAGAAVEMIQGKPYRILSTSAKGKGVEAINPIPAQEARDDYEDIQVYIPFSEEELKARADRKRSATLKTELAKIKEDIEQEVFGLVRDDFAEKKARAAEIINELRVLEGKEPREVINTDQYADAF